MLSEREQCSDTAQSATPEGSTQRAAAMRLMVVRQAFADLEGLQLVRGDYILTPSDIRECICIG